jgi:hypothetical protein
MDNERTSVTRDAAADLRDESAEARDRAAYARDEAARARDDEARSRDETAQVNQREESDRLTSPERPDEPAEAEPDDEMAALLEPASLAEVVRLAAEDRDAFRSFLGRVDAYQSSVAADRRAAAKDRQAAAKDRRAAAQDRHAAARDRRVAARHRVSMTPFRQDVTPWPSEEASDQGADTPSEAREGARDVPPPERQFALDLRAATARQTEALQSAQHAAHLATMLANSEESVAETLRGLTSPGDPEARARRLALAEEAAQGARMASQRGERLRELAAIAATHVEMSTQRALLNHAAMAFGELARAERAMASAMELLAAHELSEPVTEYRREAEEARAAAQQAADRADELHRLESATHHHSDDHAEDHAGDRAEDHAGDRADVSEQQPDT